MCEPKKGECKKLTFIAGYLRSSSPVHIHIHNLPNTQPDPVDTRVTAIHNLPNTQPDPVDTRVTATTVPSGHPIGESLMTLYPYAT